MGLSILYVVLAILNGCLSYRPMQTERLLRGQMMLPRNTKARPRAMSNSKRSYGNGVNANGHSTVASNDHPSLFQTDATNFRVSKNVSSQVELIGISSKASNTSN
jgi:hypothetical protein